MVVSGRVQVGDRGRGSGQRIELRGDVRGEGVSVAKVRGVEHAKGSAVSNLAVGLGSEVEVANPLAGEKRRILRGLEVVLAFEEEWARFTRKSLEIAVVDAENLVFDVPEIWVDASREVEIGGDRQLEVEPGICDMAVFAIPSAVHVGQELDRARYGRLGNLHIRPQPDVLLLIAGDVVDQVGAPDSGQHSAETCPQRSLSGRWQSHDRPRNARLNLPSFLRDATLGLDFPHPLPLGGSAAG